MCVCMTCSEHLNFPSCPDSILVRLYLVQKEKTRLIRENELNTYINIYIYVYVYIYVYNTYVMTGTEYLDVLYRQRL